MSFSSTPFDVSGTLKITVSQDTIKKLPAELTEETAPSSGLYRLKPSVFRNIWLLAEVEREPPVV